MKSLLKLTTLALAASPLSAIVLPVPYTATTNDIASGSPSTVITVPFTLFTPVSGIGSRVNDPASPSGTPTTVSGEAPTFYNLFTFQVNDAGIFTFQNQMAAGIDGFIALYTNVYDPLNPLLNVITANDNSNPGDPSSYNQSSMGASLVTGVNYVLVSTLSNGDTVGSDTGFAVNKSYFTTINGPASLTFVPPPLNEIPFGVDSTLGLAVLGAVGALRLRRNRKA